MDSGKARPFTERKMGEETRASWVREGSLQRQFNFGCVYFEGPVSHICFFLSNSLSRLWSGTISRAALDRVPLAFPTFTTEQPTICLAPLLKQGSQGHFLLHFKMLSVPSRKCRENTLGRNSVNILSKTKPLQPFVPFNHCLC